ncbi:MAG: class I SAM-dependent methyltransferase [Calditrichota bacterium]
MPPKPSNLEPGRPARTGQFILERRFRIVQETALQAGKTPRLLDLGCGNAAQTVFFLEQAGQVIGLDRTHLAQTENPAPHDRFVPIQGDAERLPFRSNSLDLVVSFEVLEHLSSDVAAVREVFRILKPGGGFFFTIPNHWWIFESHGANIPGLNWIPWNRIPLLSWLPSRLHDRIARARIYTLKQARRLARTGGFIPQTGGYVTAPLDVLPEGSIRRLLRRTIFKRDTTRCPFLAVNLFIYAIKPGDLNDDFSRHSRDIKEMKIK